MSSDYFLFNDACLYERDDWYNGDTKGGNISPSDIQSYLCPLMIKFVNGFLPTINLVTTINITEILLKVVLKHDSHPQFVTSLDVP